jgi:hypothetical protein
MDAKLPGALDRLPLFATDAEISVAVVGRERAEKWRRERLPTLATKAGFPPIDPFHGGRPVALVWKFYQHYMGLAPGGGRQDEGEWKRAPKRKSPG